MPTRVLLLRHAETANPLIFHGAESDVGLSERGTRQALAVAAHLAGFRPTVVVSSAMRRALDTAHPIARACGVAVRVEPELHERKVGPLSGTPAGLHEGPWPDTVRRWLAGQTDYATPGAESLDAIRGRVLPVWERVAADLPDQTFVVVAHGIVIRTLLLSLLDDWSVADWHRLGPVHNVGVSELVLEGPSWRAVRMNEVIHGQAEG